ncbi:sigma-54-dependent Fis family transcriptional regulator [Anaeromyxobacter oryzisoli]|uniref:sigma-54-dependent Fis family transcriptional regulator n=1 Tax=Anaeromyxobacter oryzisoli TaxID=2925408 RepID=UPI001F59F484|nr:sigma 54-interacting transcriptional regulator [Anaeromyxobacter sp. SG63]
MRRDLADRPAIRRQLDRAWARFVGDGVLDGVRPEIARSWTRARDVYRIDRTICRAPVVPTDDLWQRRCEEDEAYVAAGPVLEAFSARLREAGHVLALFDAAGWLLHLGGDPAVADALATANFRPGASWREDATGTNGPGTTLVERCATEVFASEHFVEAWHGWTSAAAPILVPGSDAPVGVVDLTAPWDAPAPPALATAAAIAAAISERLRARQAVRDGIVRYALRDARDSGDALVAVDARGRVLEANGAALRRLALEDGELPVDARDRVLAALRGAAGAGDDALPIEWAGHGGDRRRAFASVVTHEGAAVGAILRVLPPATTARAARGAPSPAAMREAFAPIRGRSEAIRAAIDLARVAARNDLPVVLVGESGTGKELFAQGIHAASARAEKRLVALNCGAIPTALVEAELFGYEPGTFTGGQREGKAGKLEEANGGTLFLDEVSELPAQAQTALLRVLQEREVVRLGGSRARPVDVRIVAATNRRLDGEVAAGRFRHDLFFRLNVLSIPIPPLRDRLEDVPLLARTFLAEAEERMGRVGLTLSDAALEVLAKHRWPGNVRELENAIMRAAAVVAAPPIEPRDLLLVDLRGLAPRGRPATCSLPCQPDPSLPCEQGASGPCAAGAGRRPEASAAEDEPGREELVAALDASGWNIARTASSLGVSRMTLYRRLRKFGITR